MTRLEQLIDEIAHEVRLTRMALERLEERQFRREKLKEMKLYGADGVVDVYVSAEGRHA